MRSLNRYISEKFQIGKDYKRQYAYTPKDKDELIECIMEKIKKEGPGTEDNPLDLNDIDTSNITDMTELFDVTTSKLKILTNDRYFDIFNWDVSNVTNMEYMFYGSDFNGDISEWDVSNVKNMSFMFYRCEKFNGDLSNWNVKIKNVENMYRIFGFCPLEKNPPKWYHA